MCLLLFHHLVWWCWLSEVHSTSTITGVWVDITPLVLHNNIMLVCTHLPLLHYKRPQSYIIIQYYGNSSNTSKISFFDTVIIEWPGEADIILMIIVLAQQQTDLCSTL
jgi:hypothetical protein